MTHGTVSLTTPRSYISQHARRPGRKFRLRCTYKAASKAAESERAMRSRGEPAAAAMGRARRNDSSCRNLGWTAIPSPAERRSAVRTAQLCDSWDFSPSRDDIYYSFFKCRFVSRKINRSTEMGAKVDPTVSFGCCDAPSPTRRDSRAFEGTPPLSVGRWDHLQLHACGRNNGSVFFCVCGGDNGIIPLWTEELCDPSPVAESLREYFAPLSLEGAFPLTCFVGRLLLFFACCFRRLKIDTHNSCNSFAWANNPHVPGGKKTLRKLWNFSLLKLRHVRIKRTPSGFHIALQSL